MADSNHPDSTTTSMCSKSVGDGEFWYIGRSKAGLAEEKICPKRVSEWFSGTG